MTDFCQYIPAEYPFTGKEEVKEEKKQIKSSLISCQAASAIVNLNGESCFQLL